MTATTETPTLAVDTWAADPAGGQRTGFSATTTISRAAFGVDIEFLTASDPR